MGGGQWVWVHLMGEKKVFHPGRQEGRQAEHGSSPSSALIDGWPWVTTQFLYVHNREGKVSIETSNQ